MVVEDLGFTGGQVALPVLSAASRTAPRVRILRCGGLMDAATVAGIPIVQKTFSDQDEQVRLHAALMLRKIGHRSGVPLLGQVVLSDNSTAVRAAGPRTWTE